MVKHTQGQGALGKLLGALEARRIRVEVPVIHPLDPRQTYALYPRQILVQTDS